MNGKKGLLLVFFMFGGAILTAGGSLLTGLIKHGDATYEFRNQPPRLTSYRNGQIVGPSNPHFHNRRGTSSAAVDPGQLQANPFMDQDQ